MAAGGGTVALYAQVALPLAVDKPFTYAVPGALAAKAAVGKRALAPVNNRIHTGFIVGLTDTTERTDIRELAGIPDADPVLSNQLLALCAWVADYYCCSLGEACQCAAPPGTQARIVTRYTLQPEALETTRLTDLQRRVIAALHRHGTSTIKRIDTATGKPSAAALKSLAARGLVRTEHFIQPPSIKPNTETWAQIVPAAVPSPEKLMAFQRRAPQQAALYLDLLHGHPERPATELFERHKATSATLRALQNKGLILCEEREIYRLPDARIDDDAREKHPLNAEQQAAFDHATAAIDAGAFQTFLLHGITGSGKTEVYLQIIEHALASGLDAILLVPEIALTPQTVGRFRARFDTQIAVLHSALSPRERYDEWRRAQRGEVRIVVGARSAIFAPLPNVGVIIVDEEHDTSYKQTETPRYHARDVAIMRANLSGAVCVLGSATPSIESFYNSETGKSRRLPLTRRATDAPLPEVTIVDMREEVRQFAGEVWLSGALEHAIHRRLDAREQVILLLNRRGHSPFVLCPQCGWSAQCDDCQVSLTYHTGRGAARQYLSCHYCNARKPLPLSCEACKFNPLVHLGAGTQKIEDLLARTFPSARIDRMDRDTTSGKARHAHILARFARGDVDILVGTQMIAKGHDYPGVTLVGVLNADIGLGLPDFRAAETGFQLLTQVAGRAGRGDRPGEVFIQTFRPHHYAVEAATTHDYAGFYAHEIEQRRAAGYPPFRRMLNLAIECEDPWETERAVNALERILRDQIRALDFTGIAILGPAPATIRRVKKKYRWNLGAFSKSAKRLNALARAVRDAAATTLPRNTTLKIDLDPYGLF